jgi:topoisomerase-4 subunit B
MLLPEMHVQQLLEYYSFVNGQFTTQGGTHLSGFREGIVKTIREFYKKDYDS